MGIQLCHLGNSAGVIGYRSISVNRYGRSYGRKHPYGRYSDTINISSQVSNNNSYNYCQQGKGRAAHSQGKTADDIGGAACLGSSGELLNRLEMVRGIVIGQLADHNSRNEAGNNGNERSNLL